MHIDNKKRDILILGEGPTQGLDDTTLTAEAEYSNNFSRLHRKFCLRLRYNGSSTFLFDNYTKMYQFKQKYSEIKRYPLCLGYVSGDFCMKKHEQKNNNNKKKIKWVCVRYFCWS